MAQTIGINTVREVIRMLEGTGCIVFALSSTALFDLIAVKKGKTKLVNVFTQRGTSTTEIMRRSNIAHSYGISYIVAERYEGTEIMFTEYPV